MRRHLIHNMNCNTHWDGQCSCKEDAMKKTREQAWEPPAQREHGELAPGEIGEPTDFWAPPKETVPLVPGSFQNVPHDTVDVIVTAGQTVSAVVHVGNPSELGLYVPTLTTPTTVQVRVAYASDGTGGANVVDKGGTQILSLASGSGNVNIGGNDMGACLGYPYLYVVLGATQAADKTFKLIRKVGQTRLGPG